MTILDAAILVGRETTYGTPAPLTRGYEGKADSFKREQEALESTGFRAGLQTVHTDRRRVINMGGAGGLEVDVLSSGMGLLLEAAFGTANVVGTSDGVGGTVAPYTHSFETASEGPATSLTVQVQRPSAEGGVTPFTHHGAVCTSLSLGHEVGGLFSATFEFDFEDVDTATAAGVPTYPDGALPFSWDQATVLVNGVAVDARSFEFTMDNALKTDRRYLRGSALKKRPVRGGLPEMTGTLTTDFEGTALYDLWTAGDIFTVQAQWTLDAGHTVTLDLAACQFDGESPEASMDDLTVHTAPFKVLWNGTDPAAALTVVTDDAAF